MTLHLDDGRLVPEIDAGVCPNLMTRFREEVYESRWYKALVKASKKAESAELLSKSEDPGPQSVRFEYHAQPYTRYRKVPKAASQEKLI